MNSGSRQAEPAPLRHPFTRWNQAGNQAGPSRRQEQLF